MSWRERLADLIQGTRFRRVVLGAIFVALLWNGRQYPANDGYDYGAHRDYSIHLYEERALPGFDVSNAAYNPPGFYVLGAAMIFLSEHGPPPLRGTRPKRIMKMLIAFAACAFVFYSMQLCGWLLGDSARTPYLLFLGTVPAFYRTSAMYTPEMFLTLVIWLGIFIGVRAWTRRGELGIGGAVGVGIFLALAVWTRPLALAAVAAWGLTLVYFFFRNPTRRASWVRSGTIIIVLASVGCLSLFALNLQRFGSIMAYSDKQKSHDGIPFLKRQPLSFHTEWKPSVLFSYPVRPRLGNRWMPILYSDGWGDYWKYWSLNHEVLKEEGRDVSEEFWARILAVQNILALIPTLMIALGFGRLGYASLKADPDQPVARYVPILLMAGVAGAFFFYFIVSTPHPETDHVKATYLNFLVPCFAMGGAYLFQKLLSRPDRITFWLVPYCLVFWIWSFAFVCIYWHNL